MNLKKNVFALALSAALTTSAFANTIGDFAPESKPKAIVKEIKSMIQKLDIDVKTLDSETIKVKFMVNESDELIVISTGNSELDNTIKTALNYREVSTDGLKPFKVYVVPVTFAKA